METQWKTTTTRDGGITTTALEMSQPVNRQKIAALAYEFWRLRGCPEGTSEEDWFRAEQEVKGSQETNLND
jgi:Protein of unknown function (DUF2934)